MTEIIDNIIGVLEELLESNKQEKIQLVVALQYLKDKKIPNDTCPKCLWLKGFCRCEKVKKK